jgi:O-antigen ligase
LITSVADLRRVLLALIITVLPQSLIGIFETAKGWLLYSSFIYEWRDDLMLTYLAREGLLRANASAGNSIVLGFIIMVAIGCMLAVRQSIGSRIYSRIALTILSAGLVGSLARGPWFGAMILVVLYLAISPNPIVNLTKFAVVGTLMVLLFLLTPVGGRLLDLLPFIGSAEQGSVTYRQSLFQNAIEVIQRNPWFGSRDFMLTPEMKELIQGQHILDLVNTYLSVTLNYGVVGLGFFLSFFVTILIGLRRVLKLKVVRETELGACIRGLIATFVAILVTIATVSSIGYIPCIYWSFAGLCVAIIRIAYQEQAALAGAADAIQVPTWNGASVRGSGRAT